MNVNVGFLAAERVLAERKGSHARATKESAIVPTNKSAGSKSCARAKNRGNDDYILTFATGSRDPLAAPLFASFGKIRRKHQSQPH